MEHTNNEQPCSLSEAMLRIGHGAGIASGMSAVKINQVLHKAGMIKRLTRPSTKEGRPDKEYWFATPLGEQFGIVNSENDPAHGGDPTSVRYLPSKCASAFAHEAVADALIEVFASKPMKRSEFF